MDFFQISEKKCLVVNLVKKERWSCSFELYIVTLTAFLPTLGVCKYSYIRVLQ